MNKAIEFKPYALSPGFSDKTFVAMLLAFHAADMSDIWLVTGKPIWGKLHGKLFHLTNRVLQDSEVRTMLIIMYGANAGAQIAKGEPLDLRFPVQLLNDVVDLANEILDEMGFETRVQKSAGQNKRVAFRMNGVSAYTPKGQGASVSLRTIPLDVPTLAKMGLPPKLEDEISKGKGLTLLVGETGSGKSTLVAAMMEDKLSNGADRHIITIESPIEFDLQLVRSDRNFVVQHEVGRDIKSFYDGIVNALRQAPTDILVGEARDQASITGMIAACETGHDTFATVHASSVVGAFRRIANEFESAVQPQIIFKLLSQVRLVIVQVLLLSAKGGRRIPVREWMYFDETLKDELMKLPSDEALNRIGDIIRERKQTMRQQVLMCFMRGEIPQSEVRKMVGDYTESELDELRNLEGVI